MAGETSACGTYGMHVATHGHFVERACRSPPQQYAVAFAGVALSIESDPLFVENNLRDRAALLTDIRF